MNATRKMMGIVAVAGVALLQLATVRAQENVWEGYPRDGRTTDWFEAGNWSQLALPGRAVRPPAGESYDPADLVAIAANDDQVLIDSAQVAEAVRINLWGDDASAGAPSLLTIKSDLDLSNHIQAGSTGVGSGTVDHISGTVRTAVDFYGSYLLLESGGTYNLYKNATLNTIGSDHPSQLRGGTFNAYGGTLSVPNQGLAVGYSDNQTSTMLVSGGSTIDMSGIFDVGYGASGYAPHAVLRVIGANTITADRVRVGGFGTAEVTAVIDQTGFNPITAANAVDYHYTNPDLRAELRGGVLLTTADHYDLFEGSDVETLTDWGSTPDGIWSTSIAAVEVGRQAVRIQLDPIMQAGTLSAEIGQQISLFPEEGVEGYVTFNSLQQEQALLELALGFAGEGTADEAALKALVDDFTAGLSEAGYDWMRMADFEVGLDMSLSLAAGEDTADFAWDLSEYWVNPQLELSTITVIPEPNTLGLLMLIGVVTIIRRLRMR